MPAATMEHGSAECFKEMFIKAEVEETALSTAYGEIEHMRKDAGLVLRREPGLSVREIVEDDWQDADEQHCAPGASTPPVFDRLDVSADSANLDDAFNIKEEMADIDVYPTVHMHMDTHQPNLSVARQASAIYQDQHYHALINRVKEEADGDMCGGALDNPYINCVYCAVFSTMDVRRRSEYGCQQTCEMLADLQPGNKETPPQQQAQPQLYGCDHCPKVFKFMASFNEHKKYKHSTESPKYEKQAITNADGNEQQYVETMSSNTTPAGTGIVNEACSTGFGDLLNIKHEMEEMDIGPTLLQHMDIHFTINKQNKSAITEENTVVDYCCNTMRCKVVKKQSVEVKLTDSHPPQKATMMEQGACRYLQSLELTMYTDHLGAICRVNLIRLEIFQCDSCNTIYTAKPRLLQHLQNVHSSMFVKCHKINEKQHAIGKKTKSHKYCGQTMTDEDYDMAHLKYCLGQQKVLRQHYLAQHQVTSFNGFKCDAYERVFRKPHLLRSTHKKHQRNKSKTSVMNSDAVARPSDHRKNKTVNRKALVCNFCKNVYSSKASLYLHKRKHSGIGLSVCKICNAKFSSKSNLAIHLRIHTGEKPFECTTCGARYAQSGDLTRHIRIHTGEKPYKCAMCDLTFARSGYLTIHMRLHTGKPYQCDVCNIRFTRNYQLTVHMRIHTGEKPYQCVTCDAQFAHNGALTRHMKIHTLEKPYSCDVCDASFATSSHLTIHMRVHMDEKSYQCDMCDARFKHNSKLSRHMREVHKREKTLHCDV